MENKLVCDLKTGKWGPKTLPGSGQASIGPATSPPRNQLEPDVFSEGEKEQIRQAIRRKYAVVSTSAEGKFKYKAGKEGAVALKYDEAVLADMPDELLSSFCGVGNPFSLDDIIPGSSVLDIGSGAGFDLIVASRLTGSNGRACGVDLTEEMVQRSRENFAKLGIKNIETRHVSSEVLPFEDNTFDVIISNGVINLSPAKDELFKEIYRVLKPDGRLQFADMVLDGELPAGMAGSMEAWSQWIGGVVSVRDQLTLLENAGFSKVEFVGNTEIRTSECTVGALFKAYRD